MPMRSARIAELLEPFLSNPSHSESGLKPIAKSAVLSRSQLDHISTYIDLLIRWNSRINLTAIRDPEEVVTRHFGESLFAARHLFPGVSSGSAVVEGGARLADLGSGAGFPGIPIKLWAPAIALTLIESNHKKATFLREVVRSLTLTNIDIQNARAEAITQTYEIVTLRAIEHFEDALRVAARLTTPTGRMALLIGSSQLDETHSTLPQVTWQSPVPVPQSQSRILLIGRWNHAGE
ncbi:MAG: 16S rRNA (guanine(527)-N(7))-methyltransferase RsmG [Candidatus Sulfotelmatobacter sp.]